MTDWTRRERTSTPGTTGCSISEGFKLQKSMDDTVCSEENQQEEKKCTNPDSEIPPEFPQEYREVFELRKKYPKIAEAFEKVFEEQYILFAKKHLDYGMWNLAAGSRLETPEEVGFTLEGIWWRISDKISRWKNIMFSGKSHNEALRDTFQDIVNYAIIAQIITDGNWKE